MNIKLIKFITMIGLATMIAGCVVAPPVAKARIKTVAVLEAEHKHRGIAVVTVKPAKSRHCWKHAWHWHCNR